MSGFEGALGGILVLAALGLFWASAINARDRAREVARSFCQRQGWQLLDQTVTLRRLRPVRGERGLEWQRLYRFDFSPDGGRRLSGELSLTGRRLDRIWAEREDGGRVIE
ncbi:MAG: DUF3301 domain-containing protein [Wenzhouxiangella sp.]